MNTQLTTTNGDTRVGPLGSAIEGMEELGVRDFVIPRFSIIQLTSQKEGSDDHIGEFMRNTDSEFRTSLDVVVLKISPRRLKWSADRSEGRPECASRDLVHGSVPRDETGAYGECRSCRFNLDANPTLLQQRIDARKRGDDKPPPCCNYGYDLICADPDTGSLAFLGAMGTAVRPVKTLATTFQMRHRPPFSAVTHVELILTKNTSGKYYVPSFAVTEWLADFGPWRDLYLSIKGADVHDVEEVEAAPELEMDDLTREVDAAAARF